jgi:hypothetical protein
MSNTSLQCHRDGGPRIRHNLLDRLHRHHRDWPDQDLHRHQQRQGRAPDHHQDQLRQGSSSSLAGRILETRILNAANLGRVTFSTKLTPGTTYALCETLTAGWMTALAPPFYTVPDNSSICRDFTPTTVGQVSSFAVNNVPVSAHLTRTIGFWTNWSSVNGGGQSPKLDQMLAASEQVFTSVRL